MYIKKNQKISLSDWNDNQNQSWDQNILEDLFFVNWFCQVQQAGVE